jgi:hypothetical protein
MMAKDQGSEIQRPGFPEEAREAGHDAEPTPARAAKDVGVRRAAARAVAGLKPSPKRGHEASQAAVDAAFLVKGFGIPPGQSAKLVSDSKASQRATANEARQLLSEDDPLRDVPVPKEPASDLTTDTDEERLKPVLHQPARSVSKL